MPVASDRARDRLWLAALLAAAAALFLPVVLGGRLLAWDDDRFLYQNKLYLTGGFDYVRAAVGGVQFESYAPVHLLSYLPDRGLWIDWAGGYHLMNVALYLGGLACLFALARRHAGAPAAFAACLLFALHPLRVEPVAWVSARKDLLALLFVAATLLVEDEREGTRPSPRGLLLGALALLSKASTVCLPLLLLCHLRWLRRRPWREALLRAAPYAVGAAAMALVTHGAWSEGKLILRARPDPVWIDAPATLSTYAWRTLVPLDLSPLYPQALPAARVAAAGFAAAALALALTWRRLPAAARYAPLAFVAALLPVANLVPMTWRLADRYSLLAHAALVVPLALALAALARRRAPLPALAAALALVCAAEAALATPLVLAWRRSPALFALAVERQPGAYLAHMKLGEVLRDAGDFDGAIAQYQIMVRQHPEDVRGYAGLFYAYARREEAAERVAPGSADYWLSSLAGAIDDPPGFARLRARVARAGCAPCAGTLLLLGLRRWPQPDEALLAEATRALDAGDATSAAIYLSVVADTGSEAFRNLSEKVVKFQR